MYPNLLPIQIDLDMSSRLSALLANFDRFASEYYERPLGMNGIDEDIIKVETNNAFNDFKSRYKYFNARYRLVSIGKGKAIEIQIDASDLLNRSNFPAGATKFLSVKLGDGTKDYVLLINASIHADVPLVIQLNLFDSKGANKVLFGSMNRLLYNTDNKASQIGDNGWYKWGSLIAVGNTLNFYYWWDKTPATSDKPDFMNWFYVYVFLYPVTELTSSPL